MNFARDNGNGYDQHGYRIGFAPINNTPQNCRSNTVNPLMRGNYRQQPYRNPQANINNSNIVAPSLTAIHQGQEFQNAYGFGSQNNVPQYIASPPHQYAPQHQQKHPLSTGHQNTVPMNQIPPIYHGTSNEVVHQNQTFQESPMNFQVPSSNETQTSNDSFSLGTLHQMDIDNDGLQKNDETIDFNTMLKITEPLPVLSVKDVDEILANQIPRNCAPNIQQEVTNNHHNQSTGGINLSNQAPVDPLMLPNNHTFVPQNRFAKIRYPKRIGNSSISKKHQNPANLPPIPNQQANKKIENGNVENVRVETRGRKPKYTTKQEKQAARNISVKTYYDNNQSAAARNLQRTLLEKECEKLETANKNLKETVSELYRFLESQALLMSEADKNYIEQELLRIQQIGQNEAEESETESESEEDI